MRLNESKQRFSIRKLTIGVASVLIGTTFYLTSGQTVHADTTNDTANQITVTEQTSQKNKNSAPTPQKQTTNTKTDQQSTTTLDTANSLNVNNNVTTSKNVPTEKDSQKDEGANNTNSANSIAPSTPSARTRELKAQDNEAMNVTINVVDQDEDNKVIASQVWSNVGNGSYTHLNVPDAGNYYSTGGTDNIPGVTFAGDCWTSFTDPNTNWTYPNLKWDADAADKLNGQILNIYVKNKRVTINVVDQDDNDKVIASQVWSNPGNGRYTTLNVPNAGNYYSTGSTNTIDGITFAGDYWTSFTNKNCNWTHPNLKWDPNVLDKLYGQTLDIYVKHRTVNVSNTDPNAKKTITETINITNPDGSKDPVVRSVTFDRTATKDLVTGNVSYGDWNEASQTFVSYNVPTIKGYTPSQATIPAQTVKPDDTDLTFDITYTKDAPIGIKADADNPATETITRTINFDGVDLDPVVQSVTFTRVDKNGNIGYQDAANGEITYNAWTPADSTFPSYIPAKYTKDSVTYIPTTIEVPSETVTSDMKNETVTVTYYSQTDEIKSAESNQDALAVIIYQDEAGNTVSTQTQAGQPGVQVKLEVPAGYHIVGTTPDVVITADMKPMTVVIAPDDNENNNGSTIPNTPDTPSTTPTNSTSRLDSENNSNSGKKTVPVKKHGKPSSSINAHVSGISNNHSRHSVESKSSSDTTAASANAGSTSSSKKLTNSNDNELPQTGENESSTTSVFVMLAIALGGLMGLAVDRKKKRN